MELHCGNPRYNFILRREFSLKNYRNLIDIKLKIVNKRSYRLYGKKAFGFIKLKKGHFIII